MKDYYSILDLHQGASQEEIKHAFRKLATEYHPDSNLGKELFLAISLLPSGLRI